MWNQTTAQLSDIIRLVGSDSDQLACLLKSEDHRLLYDSFRIFNLSPYRVHLETFLLAAISQEEIVSIVHLDPDILKTYVSAFFDTSTFKTYIDRHQYVAGIQDQAERKLKEEWTKDTNYLKWRMGFRTETDTKAILTEVLSEVYYRFRTSGTNKDANKLCDLTIKAANKLIDATDSEQFMEDIKLALKFKQPDFEPYKK